MSGGHLPPDITIIQNQATIDRRSTGIDPSRIREPRGTGKLK